MEKIEKRIGFEVRQLSNAIKCHGEQHGKRYECQNISMLQQWIIGYLADQKEDIYQKDLEKEFHIGKSTLTEILHVMEKNDLVRRCPSKRDARCKKLVLTKRAQEIHEEVQQDIVQYERQLREGISDEELEQFFDIMNRILHNAVQDAGCEDASGCCGRENI